MVKRLIEFSINRDYDRSVRFTILCIHVSILIRFLHTFSRMLSVSYYIVKSDSRTLSNVRFWLTCKGDCSSCAILCCLEKCCPLITFCEYCKRGVHAVSSKWPNVLFLEQTGSPSTSQTRSGIRIFTRLPCGISEDGRTSCDFI